MGATAVAAPPLNCLPVGFRFHPTDEELVSHYLKRKIDGRIDPSAAAVIPLVDVCKSEPWDLPDKAGFRSGDPEWFFFAAKDRKYPGGSRSNRATEAGYWKATGKDRMIRSRAAAGKAPVLIGTKKTLVFHTGRAPKGERTGWIMHEYRTAEPEFEYGAQGGFVLCRLFKKPLEKSSVTCVDEMENDVSSHAAKVFSPVDTQHEPDVPEEFATPSDQEIPLGDFHEETQTLADEIGSTTYPLVLENSHCTTDNHETEMVGAEDDPLLEALMQFCSPEQEPLVSDGFPGITSPMRPYTDHPFFEDIKHDYCLQLCEVVNTQEDSVTEFLSSVLGNQDDYSSEVSSTQRDSTFERAPNPVFYKPEKEGASPLDLVSGKESASSSDIETDITQAIPSFVASEWFEEPPNSSFNQIPLSISSSNQDDISKVNDSDSMTSAAHSLHAFYSMGELTNQDEFERTEIKFGTPQPWQPADSDMQEPISQQNLVHNPATFEGTGIKVRPRQHRLLDSGGSVLAHQGTASRRIRLQIGSMTDTLSTSSHDDDHQDKAARTEEEENTYQNIAGAEVSTPASQDKLAVFADDGDTSSTNTDSILSEINGKSDSQLRCRKQKANSVGTTLKGLSDPMRNRAGPVAIYVTCLILFVMLMLCVGMWWCMTPQRVQIENNHV